MFKAKSIDTYVRNVYFGKLFNIAGNYFIIASIGLFYFLFASKLKLPFWSYIDRYPLYSAPIILIIPLAYLIWRLWNIRRIVGNQLWYIRCPQCDNYLSLHEWQCEEPCGKVYKERSIVEGCPHCGTRYKKRGVYALNYTVCDTCGYMIRFSDPFVITNWSVLWKGDTWDTETLVVNRRSVFLVLGSVFAVIGLILILLYGLETYLNDYFIKQLPAFHYEWDYFLLFGLGLLFLIIHFVFYRKRRIPNPSYERLKDSKYITVTNYSFYRLCFIFYGLLSLIAGLIWLLYIARTKYFYPYSPYTGELKTFTLNEILVGVGLVLAGLILLALVKLLSPEFVQKENPHYKEEYYGSSR